MKQIKLTGYIARDKFTGVNHTKIYFNKPDKYDYGDTVEWGGQEYITKPIIKIGECKKVEIIIKQK